MSALLQNLFNIVKPHKIPELPISSEFEFKDVPYPYPLKYLKYKDCSVACIDVGTGEPLLFLHGQGASLMSFTHVFEAFTGDYRVCAIDFPGFGKSGKPDFDYTVDFYRDFIKSMVNSLGYPNVWLIGHSFGGLIALIFAEEYPEMVSGLTLIDSGGFYDYSYAAEMMFRGAFSLKTILTTPVELAEENYRKLTIHHMSPEAEKFLKIRMKLFKHKTKEYIAFANAMIANLDVLFSKRYHDKILKFDFPVHLIWGEYDRMVPVTAFENAKESIPAARADLIKDCGHFPILERPEEFAALAKSFIDEKVKA